MHSTITLFICIELFLNSMKKFDFQKHSSTENYRTVFWRSDCNACT